MCACVIGSVDIPVGGSTSVFDMSIEYPYYLYEDGILKARLCGPLPWRAGVTWSAKRPLGGVIELASVTGSSDNFTITVLALSESSVTVEVVRCGPDFIGFVDVAVSLRYGERLYLSGTIENVAESDEICVYFSRPGDTGIRNLKSDTSDYLYFKDASGSYDLGANNRYIEFERAGYHWLQIWDVSGNCETPVAKRAEWLMNVILPRYQYQLIFDLEDPDLGDNLWRLEAEYAKYAAAGSWFVNHDKPDCFTHIQPINTPEDDTPASGWLSLGVEFGESPCAPIPYYLCPLPTPQTQYWRGECSCDLFKNTLQPLGIPCSHLIAAMNWYSGEPAWSDYVKCP